MTNDMNNGNNKLSSLPQKKIIIGVVVVVIVIVVGVALLISKEKEDSGEATFNKNTSEYSKVCTLSSDFDENNKMNMTFGLYKQGDQIMQDTVIMWESKNGKINIPEGSSENEVVSKFAALTGMTMGFSGTTSNTNNYYKDGKVYITNTVAYDSSQISTIDSLANRFKTDGATCK